MNLWNDSGLRSAPETESKPEIERNYLHHRDMSKSVKYNNTSLWPQHTRLLSTKCPIWKKKWISGMIRDWNVLQKPNYNPKLKETICIIEICPNQWSTTLLPNDPIIHVSYNKVSNLNKINDSLECFGTEMSTRNRIKTRNWKKPSAS